MVSPDPGLMVKGLPGKKRRQRKREERGQCPLPTPPDFFVPSRWQDASHRPDFL